jgi:hypothetical protein
VVKKFFSIFFIIGLIIFVGLSPAYSQSIPSLGLSPVDDDYYYVLPKDKNDAFYADLDVKANDQIINGILPDEVAAEITQESADLILNPSILGINFGISGSNIQSLPCNENQQFSFNYRLVNRLVVDIFSLNSATVTINIRRGDANTCTEDPPPPPECEDSGGCDPPPPDDIEVIANDDQYNISIGSNTPNTNNTKSMAVLSNDIFPNNFSGCTLTIDDQPSSGTVSKSGENLIFTYNKDIVAPGVPEQFSFYYTISCGGVSDSARVDLNISSSNDGEEPPPPECEAGNCESPPPPPPPPPDPDCDLCILFGYFNASLGEIQATLNLKLADITLKIGQIALNLTYINNKITDNINNPPPPPGDNPPPPDDSGGDDSGGDDSGGISNDLPCSLLPPDYTGGPLEPIADSGGVIKPWCEYRQIVVCPNNLFEVDNFASIIFGEYGLPSKFPMDMIGEFPGGGGSGSLILTFQGKDFDLGWWLSYINIIKIPAWIAFMVWVLVRL